MKTLFLTPAIMALLWSGASLQAKDIQLNFATSDPASASSSASLALSLDLPAPDLQEEPDLEQVYTAAVHKQAKARREHFRLELLLARRQREEALALIEKSLVEREESHLDQNCAAPEATPAIDPFSSSRPEPIVSSESMPDFITTPLDATNLVATAEPSTWALFGLGAGLLIFTVPARGRKNQPRK
jgi:hypothetical protein